MWRRWMISSPRSTISPAIESALKVTPFYNSDDWRLFLKLTPELRVVLRDLQDVAFEIYWRGNVLPIVEGRIREYTPRSRQV